MFFPRRSRTRRQHTASFVSRSAAVRQVDALEDRTLLSSVSVVAGELRVDGLSTETNNFTVDYDAGTDTYTITDSNALTAGVGAAQVDPNTVTVAGGGVNDRVRVLARNSPTGINTIDINANGGAGWGNEGLQVNDQPAPTEIITVGVGGIDVQAGAIRGDVSLLGDVVNLGGDITTADGNIALNRNNDGGTTDVTGPSVLTAGGSEDVNFNGTVTSAATSDLTASGQNVFFDDSVTGLGLLSVTAENVASTQGDLNATTAYVQGDTIVDIDGLASGTTLTFNSPVIEIDDVDVAGQLTFQAGAIDIVNSITGNGTAIGVLQSRVAGNGITIFNQQAAPDDPDSGSYDLADIDLFADFLGLIIGGPQVDETGAFAGTNAATIDLVADFDSTTRLMFPVQTSLVADTINMNEGLTVETDDGANAVRFFAQTLNQNNPFAFAGDGLLQISSLSQGAPGLSGDLTINGRLQGRPEVATDPVPDLEIIAGDLLTVTGPMTNFASIDVDATTADFQQGTAVVSNGALDVIADTVISLGGFTADGDILIDGDLEQSGRNLLFSRGGGDIEVTGDVIGNGFDLSINGNKNTGVNAGTVTFGGNVDGVSRFIITRADDLTLGGTLTALGGASGSDININIAGLLEIGDDITGPNRVDIKAATIDLIGDEDHTIDSVNDVRVILNGDLLGTGTLTVDIAGGQFTRNGNDGAVTVNVV